MSKRLLIILSIAVFIIAVSSAIIIWVSVRSRTTLPPPRTLTTPDSAPNPLQGFPVSSPPAPTSTPAAPAPAAISASTSEIIPPEIGLRPSAPTVTGSPAARNFLTKLSPTPVAGAVLIPRIGPAAETALFYMEESTGNLFLANPGGRDNRRLTNSTILGVAKIWWGRSRGTLTLFAQYLGERETLTTFRGTYDLTSANGLFGSPAAEPAELVGATIPNVVIGGIAVSPDRDRFFSLLNNGGGVTGTVTELLTGKVRTVFTSRFNSWDVAWPSSTIITLTPRAAAGAPGTLYFLNPDTGVMIPILGGQSGFTILTNPSGTKVLFNEDLGGLKIYSARDDKIQLLTIATLPEKCVWSSDNITIYCAVPDVLPIAQYPDDWRRGEIIFSDSFWSVNTDTGETKIILSGTASDSFDATDLILDEINRRLIFTDRWSAALWSLTLQ